MVVVVLAVVPERLRGHLTRWLMEISPGVYVGKVSARVRELLWEQIRENCKHGRAIMAYTTDNEQGLALKTHGQEWEPVDYEGLTLIMRPNMSQTQQRNARRTDHTRRTGWSKASRMRRFGR